MMGFKNKIVSPVMFSIVFNSFDNKFNNTLDIEYESFDMKGEISMLTVNNVSKKYKNKEIINNINMNINEGSSLAILGNNGAGKTTLIKIMLGLLIPTTGEVLYNKVEINKIKNKYLGIVGVVLEGNRNIYWYLTPWENLYYFGRLLGVSDENIKERGKELLILFDLYSVADKKISTFSRGMKQKVAVVISLLNNPKILFLDEPTLGLDVITKNKLIECLIKIKNKGTTIILTTHQLDIVDKIADKIYFLKNGRLLEEDKKNISFDESLIQISLKNRKTLNILDGQYIQSLILFLIENGEEIISIVKRSKNLEDIFLEIYKEKNND
ncbi:ABC transporter ATP-binding protein [Cetobacterium sp.]|uniref:ABC transporter ATP-binding protein n=1 Tax=Cetobacterium sp. TaxID=2071632 RepID=UPI003F672FF8